MTTTTDEMYIFIPTKGRVGRQVTLETIPKNWIPYTHLVCDISEVKAHLKNHPKCNVISQPAGIKSIAQKRTWMFKHAQALGIKKLMMIDDDISFCKRLTKLPQFKGYGTGSTNKEWQELRKKRPGVDALLKIGPEDPEINVMLKAVEKMLDKYRHGGIGPRLMNNQRAHEFTLNQRVMYALAYHVPTVMKHCKLGRIETREDFDYTLQLLRAGFENAVYTWGAVEQYTGYGNSGGATDERTKASNDRDARKLAKLHPGLVRIVQKNYTGGWFKDRDEMNERLEVVVSWAKAAEEGKCPLI